MVLLNSQAPDAATHAASVRALDWRSGLARASATALAIAVVCAAWLTAPGIGLLMALPAAVGAAVIAAMVARHYPVQPFGLCNSLTLWRGALAIALLAPLWTGAPGGWAVAGVAAIALCLDGLDGWSARRNGLESRFGARFDMEVDSLLAAVLALHAALDGIAWPAAVALGGARYAFVGAAQVWPWLAAPLPPQLWRKTVCVVQLATLITLQVPLLDGVAAQALAVVAACGLLASFARDVMWLRARRP